MKQRCIKIVVIVLVTVLSFTAVVSAATELSRTANLAASAPYAQTSKVTSETGNARIYGYTSNGVAAKFTILRYTTQTSYSGVYTSGELTICGTVYKNYNGLAYAGYMQTANSATGAAGSVTIYAK